MDEDKSKILLHILGIYAIVVFIVFIIHYIFKAATSYGETYSLTTLPLNTGFGILGSIIGFDLLISVPIGLAIAALYETFNKFLLPKLKQVNEDKLYSVLLIPIIYFIVFFVVIVIHNMIILIVEYGDTYNIDTVPLNLTFQILGSIILFDLIISIPISIGILIPLLWVILKEENS